ncbi:hypothetical protein HPB52_020052 [Rhipicephalus sanguineus]|uniref:Uncharacterized protein n=1 Tax=Rhipicephalus sanguineus TaxID=34632 RepID=A0A9D4PXN2_RHISA|nr:hypothetical protein HPB52_020052 [Rhipicephalus sanguineus]
MDLEKLHAIGKDMGLDGAALQEWVDAQRVIERELRAQARVDQREKLELEEKRLQAEERVLQLKLKLQEANANERESPQHPMVRRVRRVKQAGRRKSDKRRVCCRPLKLPRRRDQKKGYVVLQDGETIPIVNTTSTCTPTVSDIGTLPVVKGFLEGKSVTVLRDTGCNTVVVREALEYCLQSKDQNTSLNSRMKQPMQTGGRQVRTTLPTASRRTDGRQNTQVPKDSSCRFSKPKTKRDFRVNELPLHRELPDARPPACR